VGSPCAEIEELVSCHSFLFTEPEEPIVIRLCSEVLDRMQGAESVVAAFKAALGIDFGETIPDGKFSLESTHCIGMCDQSLSALVNDVVVTCLSADTAREIVDTPRRTRDPRQLVRRFGDGNNAHPLVSSRVFNNEETGRSALRRDCVRRGGGPRPAIPAKNRRAGSGTVCHLRERRFFRAGPPA
jgi:[NiFe] hydrogenase diaphorase moiety large subunit